MKAPVDRATTARVLAGIDAVLRERTAAAVERVLATASYAMFGEGADAALNLAGLYTEIGVQRPKLSDLLCDCNGECSAADIDGLADEATPGMVAYLGDGELSNPIDRQRRRYAPWVVSPHLFAGAVQ